MPVPDRGFPSPHDLCLIAVCEHIKALKLEGVGEQIGVRGFWFDKRNKRPYYGISVHAAGERPANGVIGFTDVAYGCAVSMVIRDDGNATTKDDKLLLWKGVIRRRFRNQRIPVANLGDGIKKHVCTTTNGRLQMPADSNDQFVGDQIIIWCWTREPYDRGE